MLILSIIVNVLALTSAKYEDYRIVDRKGMKLKWFTLLKYTLQNQRYGSFMYHNNWPRQTLDQNDPKYWHHFEKRGNLSRLNGWIARKYAHGSLDESLQIGELKNTYFNAFAYIRNIIEDSIF